MNTVLDQLTLFFVVLFSLPALDLLLLSGNLALFIFAPRILDYFYHDESKNNRFLIRLRVFRFINVMVFVLYGYHYFDTSQTASDWDITGWDFKIASILAIIYMAYLVDHIAYYFIQQRFGKEREVNGEKRIVETYNARLLGILSTTFICVIAMISLIRVLGFDSWLEAGGVVGFVGVFLALTQSSWAPDIFSGLIILNSGILEEGDVVEIGGNEKVLGVVFKTKMFHTEILNLVNNHRIMIRNARLRDYVFHNLSRFASAKGLREQLHFNVSYEVSGARMREMVDEVYDRIEQENEPNVETKHGYEMGPINAGDYAVEWVLYYYTKDIRNILQIRLKMRELIIQVAREHEVDLSTPMLNTVYTTSLS